MASKMEKSVSRARKRMDDLKDLAESQGYVHPSDRALQYSRKATSEFDRKFGDFPGIKTAQQYQDYIDKRLLKKNYDSEETRKKLKADSPRGKVGQAMLSAAQRFKKRVKK